MMSLRALTRALPRTTSRLTATRTSLRPALQTAAKTSTFPISRTTASAFSTSLRRNDATAQELAAKLSSEMQLESENEASAAGSESATAVQKFLDEGIWEVHDTPGEQEVTLTRKYEDELITVQFSIVDFNTPMMEHDQEDDDALMDEEDEASMESQSGGANTKGAINQGRTQGGNFKVAPEDEIAPADREEMRDQEDETPAFPANVTVTITRPNKGALRVNLTSEDSELTIHSFTQLPAGELADSKTAEADHKREALYTGPPFQQLDEEVQSLMEQYLDERGINTNLAVFIPDYIDVKEQKEYLAWLGRVRGFVE